MKIKRKLISKPKYDWEIEIERRERTTIIDDNKERLDNSLKNRNKYGNQENLSYSELQHREIILPTARVKRHAC